MKDACTSGFIGGSTGLGERSFWGVARGGEESSFTMFFSGVVNYVPDWDTPGSGSY